MKLPLSWLTDMVQTDLPLEELVETMSLSGLEVEDVTYPGAGTRGVRSAQVLDFQPHPDADRLRVVQVTGEGGQGQVEVVCGASNFEVGDIVLHALPGGFVPGVVGADGSRGMELAARAIRGVHSEGMLASSRELELGDDHEGIVILPPSTPLGVPLEELVPVGEPVIEIAVQADRGDHLSVLGVARDLAAILDTTWIPPAAPSPIGGNTIPITLDTDACASFATWIVEDVQIGPSPLWLRQRLAQCGVRSIDVVVDVTNLIMLELGQPLHAFDLDRIEGARLNVRAAEDQEQVTTLDDQERTLVAGDLVIEDDRQIVSLAGVMGGASSEVRSTTTRVLLEAAVWEPRAIRSTSRRLGLVSEASQRFERAVDPAGANRAVARAAQLLADLAGGRLVASDTTVREPAPSWAATAALTVDPSRVAQLLALDVDTAAQAALLRRSGCDVDHLADGRLQVTPPTWRHDLNRAADVAEEVARLHGYHNIPATLPRLTLTGGLTPAQRAERDARGLALAAGFHEAITRPFVGEQALVGAAPSAGRVVLANPLAKDASAMRPSLVEGLVQALRRNHGQGRPGTALVEMGRIFRPHDDVLARNLDTVLPDGWRWYAPDGALLPTQPRVLALAAHGRRVGRDWLDTESSWSVEDLLAVIDEVARRLAPGDDPRWTLTRTPVERDGFHPGRTAALVLDGAEIGIVGQLHPSEANERDLPDPVVVAELVLEPFLAAIPEMGHPPIAARQLVRRPAMNVDVALVAPDEIPYVELERAVRAGAGDLIDELWWFDEYRGEQLGEGRRSVAIRMRLQDAHRQLTDQDAEQVIAAVEAEASKIGALLRR